MSNLQNICQKLEDFKINLENYIKFFKEIGINSQTITVPSSELDANIFEINRILDNICTSIGITGNEFN